MRRRGSLAGLVLVVLGVLFLVHSSFGAILKAGKAGGATAAIAVTDASEMSFIRAVLADLGAPATQANISSLASWFRHEFPSWPPWAANNPMATKLYEPGSTDYLSNGVKNYPDATTGAKATAATLVNGHYPGIVADLKSGRGLCGDSSLAGEFFTWSGNGYSSVC